MVTPLVELAKAFAHKPENVSIEACVSGARGVREIHVEHDGQRRGYLYRVAVTNADEDLRQHPGSVCQPGWETITSRDPPMEPIMDLPLRSRRQGIGKPEASRG